MWVFTETGFVSAVTHYSNSNIIVVRGRDYDSLHSIAEFADAVIQHTPKNDYPIRVEVAREVFAQWVEKGIDEMRYTNYKNQMYGTRGPEFTHALTDVWSDMHQVETARD